MRCDGSPDPTIQGEINTYMNLWKEDMRSNDIANVLKESKLTLSVSSCKDAKYLDDGSNSSDNILQNSPQVLDAVCRVQLLICDIGTEIISN